MITVAADQVRGCVHTLQALVRLRVIGAASSSGGAASPSPFRSRPICHITSGAAAEGDCESSTERMRMFRDVKLYQEAKLDDKQSCGNVSLNRRNQVGVCRMEEQTMRAARALTGRCRPVAPHQRGQQRRSSVQRQRTFSVKLEITGRG